MPDYKKTIHLIAAARPNFMKIAPLYHALKKEDWAETHLIHTGQHYDSNMSDDFFSDLGLPEPYLHLGVGSGTHAEQAGKVMMAYEKILMENPPDLTVVVGDVNSTAAATLAAVKLGVIVAHLEAGLRSNDRTMPEEINRIVTDVLADLLWTHSPDADTNLLREGIPKHKIERVGNIMIDSLEMMRPKIEKIDAFAQYGFETGSFGVVTLHRPANVDQTAPLTKICQGLARISERMPIVFPIHPRTRNQLKKNGLLSTLEGRRNLRLEEPLSYLPFMNLIFNSRLVLTDSGGIQEETSYLGIPCLTIRPNTERPITLTQGTNQLCSLEDFENRLHGVLNAPTPQKKKIEYWDGKTAGRIVSSIRRLLSV